MQKLRDNIHSLFRSYGCDNLKKEQDFLYEKCMEELEKYPSLENELNNTSNGWKYFLMQMTFESIGVNEGNP